MRAKEREGTPSWWRKRCTVVTSRGSHPNFKGVFRKFKGRTDIIELDIC